MRWAGFPESVFEAGAGPVRPLIFPDWSDQV